MPSSAAPLGSIPPVIQSVSEIADRYDGFLIDMWGVIHDGVALKPGASDCMQALRRRGGKVIILSNAPRRAEQVAGRAIEMGMPSDAFDDILSSGEETWQFLVKREDPFHASLNPPCFHLGPTRDRGMLDGLPMPITDDLETAGFVLLTGAIGHEDQVADYEDTLGAMLRRAVPMVCANPDVIVMRGDAMELCAGGIAARYEELGGTVRYHGKPHASVYTTCMGMMGIDDRKRVLMIGDGMRTDILGANRFGMDSLLILGGLHADELGMSGDDGTPDPEKFASLCAAFDAVPSFLATGMRW